MAAILNQVTKLFQIPKNDDPEQERHLQMLWLMVMGADFIGLLLLAAAIALESNLRILYAIGSIGSFWLLSIYILRLIHAGRLARAGHVFCIFLSISLFYNMMIRDGMNDTNVAPYFLLVFMAGLALRKKGLILYLGISIISLAAAYLLKSNGWVSAGLSTQPERFDVVFLTLILVITSIFIYSSLNNVDRGYALLQEALEKLKETTVSKQYADNIINSMDDMLFVLDRYNEIRTLNPAACEILKYKRQELLGKPFSKVFDKRYAPGWIEHSEGESSSYTMHQADYKMCDKEGAVIDVSMSSALIEYQPGVFGVICIAHDNSRQKEIEKALSEAKEHAEQTAMAKSNFLGNMSHELRTPLNAILGISTLMSEVELDDEQAEYVEIVSSSALSLLDTVNNVLDLSLGENEDLPLELAFFELLPSIEEIIDSWRVPAEEKGLQIALITARDLPTVVFGDEMRLKRVLNNIISNGVKFTKNGEVTVKLTVQPPDATKVEGEQGETWRLNFDVIDTGCGIDPKYIDSLFEPFDQADTSLTRQHGGTGIGLSVSKSLIERMGGEISVVSTLGKGSTFSFYIALEVKDSRHAEENSQSLAAATAQFVGQKVLFVDLPMDEGVGSPLSEQFRMWQMELTEVASSSEHSINQLIDTVSNAEYRYLVWAEPPPRTSPHLPLIRHFDNAAHIMLAPNTQTTDDLLHTNLMVVLPSDLRVLKLPLVPTQLIQLLSMTKSADQLLLHDVAVNVAIEAAIEEEAERELSAEVPIWAVQDGDEPQIIFSRLDRNEIRERLEVLIVEDNLVNQRLVTKMIERMGHIPDIASDGVEAMVCVTRKRYDIIFMDTHMPRMDGVEATKRIRARLPFHFQPVIVGMTADSITDSDTDIASSLLSDMDDYIQKPIKIDQLKGIFDRNFRMLRPA